MGIGEKAGEGILKAVVGLFLYGMCCHIYNKQNYICKGIVHIIISNVKCVFVVFILKRITQRLFCAAHILSSSRFFSYIFR